MVRDRVREAYRKKIDGFGDHQEGVLSFILLSVIDQKWRDHLYDLDHLKASIGFRGWGQKDPLIEYKQEAYSMFVELMADLRKSVATHAFRTQLAIRDQPRPAMPRRLILSGPGDGSGTGAPTSTGLGPAQVQESPVDPLAAAMAGSQQVRRRPSEPRPSTDVRNLQTNRGDDGGSPTQQPIRVEQKIGRNDPCPCGSGRKYKKCHGAT